MDKPGDERPFYDQRRFLPAMLIIAATSRDFWISRLERLHAVPSSGTQNGSATTQEIVSTRRLGSKRRYLNHPAIGDQRVSCFDQTVRRHIAGLKRRANSLKSPALHRNHLPGAMQGFPMQGFFGSWVSRTHHERRVVVTLPQSERNETRYKPKGDPLGGLRFTLNLIADLDGTHPPAIAGHHATTNDLTATIFVIVVVRVGIISVVISIGSKAKSYKPMSTSEAPMKTAAVKATAVKTASVKTASAEAVTTAAAEAVTPTTSSAMTAAASVC
jgi:hypothetical protein